MIICREKIEKGRGENGSDNESEDDSGGREILRENNRYFNGRNRTEIGKM